MEKSALNQALESLCKPKSFPQIADYLPSGIPNLDKAAGGIPRGAITEIFGGRSCGKTALVFSAIAQATGQLEHAAFVDPTDTFSPSSAEKAGIQLNRLLWTRCRGDLNAGLKAADYLLHAGGFGIVVLDMADVRPDIVLKIPQSFWYRYRLAVENTRTVFVLVSPAACTGSSCRLSLHCSQERVEWKGSPEHLLLQDIVSEYAVRKRPGMIRSDPRQAADLRMAFNNQKLEYCN